VELLVDRPRTGITSQVYKKIEEISPDVWKSVFPETLESYEFFKSLDESGFEQFSFRYLLVYDGESVVGAASFFLMHYPLETTVQGPLRSVMFGIKRLFPGLFDLKAVIAGLPMDQGRLGIKSDDPQAVIREIIACLERCAAENKANILAFKDFGAEYTELLRPLLETGFCKVQNLPSTAMDLNFGSFEDYMKTLSKASRDGLKRKLKKLSAGTQFDLEITHRLTPQALDEVYALYLQTEAHGDTQFETVPKLFFERVAVNMPEETYFFLWRKEGKMVAFAYCLAADGHFLDFYLGFDYAIAFDYHLYFVRFRDLMHWCIQNKMKKYEMGATGYEAKRRLGFKMVPIFIYAKCRTAWLNPAFKVLCRTVQPENFHQVFKEMKKGEEPCPKKV